MATNTFTQEVLSPKADEFFRDVFRGAAVRVCEYAPEDQGKIESYGVWMADVVTQDAEELTASFVFADTLYTQALEQIYAFEQCEALPTGCHDDAAEALFRGDFFDTWGKLLPLIQQARNREEH